MKPTREQIQTEPDQDVREALVELVNKAYQNWKTVGKQEDIVEIVELENTIRKALNRPAVPEGYALVPIEPTENMIAATGNLAIAKLVYRDMIAAAPKQGDV